MTFVIEPVTDSLASARAAYVREEVFEREWNVCVPLLPPRDDPGMLTLIARPESQSEPAAALTVLETTGDHDLHRRLGLVFPESARVARYTQLAVLKQYRGLNIPVQLVREARRRFVVPRGISYTWLLFDAERARSSSLCRRLGFRASPGTFNTEYGCSRVLSRNDGAAVRSPLTGWWPETCLSARNTNSHGTAPGSAGERFLADEWVA